MAAHAICFNFSTADRQAKLGRAATEHLLTLARWYLGCITLAQRLRGARKKCNLYLEVDRYYIFTCQVREMNLRQVQKLAATKTFSDMNGQHNGDKPLLKVAQSQKEPKEMMLRIVIWQKKKTFSN